MFFFCTCVKEKEGEINWKDPSGEHFAFSRCLHFCFVHVNLLQRGPLTHWAVSSSKLAIPCHRKEDKHKKEHLPFTWFLPSFQKLFRIEIFGYFELNNLMYERYRKKRCYEQFTDDHILSFGTGKFRCSKVCMYFRLKA